MYNSGGEAVLTVWAMGLIFIIGMYQGRGRQSLAPITLGVVAILVVVSIFIKLTLHAQWNW